MEEKNMAKKIQRDPKSVALAQAILEQYQPETKEDVQDAMKEIFGSEKKLRMPLSIHTEMPKAAIMRTGTQKRIEV